MPQRWLVMYAEYASWVCLLPGLGLHTTTASSGQDAVVPPIAASPAVGLEVPCMAAQVAGSTLADQPADVAREGPPLSQGGSAGSPPAQAADCNSGRALYLFSHLFVGIQETACVCRCTFDTVLT